MISLKRIISHVFRHQFLYMKLDAYMHFALVRVSDTFELLLDASMV